MSIITEIKNNAKRITALNNQIKEFYNSKDVKKWKLSTDNFHDNYDKLAFPGGLKKGLSNLDNKVANAIENAVLFLEANPYFFRSGYIKEILLSKLCNIQLTNKQTQRLRTVILNIIDNFYCREFRYYCKLAKKLNTTSFLDKLHQRKNLPNHDIATRARWVVDYIENIN